MFAAKEVSYLGHRVTEEGLLLDSSLLVAIREIPPPKTATEVCSFLGLAGYYRRYVKNFAAIAGPLHALTRKDAVFHWSAECQTAFDKLKTLLMTSPITAFPDFSQAFRLYTDASTTDLGAILAQVRDGKERIICCASRALNQAEKAYPATKLECLAIVWAVAKFRPYLMAMPFEVFTDHYALQWLKMMRTGSALLHRWSAALEEYDFTVRHRPGKAQTHVDGLSWLPVGPAPPEDMLLHVQVHTEEEARKLAQELHSATHLGGQALWKLFSYRYAYKAGRRLCIEVAQSCPQCQLGSNYGHRLKTTGTIQSRGPWDTLSVDIVGPLPADHRHEFLIVFVDCYSRYTILFPASNHTANTVSDALLRHVVLYFGTPRRLLSDRGREFVGEVWGKLMSSLGVQHVLTSPYHPEGNDVNERSYWTMNNMLRTRLLEGTSSKAWVEKVPGIMMALNAMVHEPHGFSASMVATGREPTLPPDLQNDACASPSLDDPTDYVEMLRQHLSMTHQQMTVPPPPASANPYQEGSLIFVMTTPPERTNKLTSRWKGPFRVKRVPNPYQVVYEDGSAWRMIHVNHAKPAKLTGPDLPLPTPAPEPPRQALGYLLRSLQRPRSHPPPPPLQAAAPTGGTSSPPTASVPTPPAPPPPASERPNRGAALANRNLAPPPQLPTHPRSKMQPPTSAPANQNSGSVSRPRRSATLNPGLNQACSIKGPPWARAPQSQQIDTMAQTYPLSAGFNQCLGAKEEPFAFSSVCVEDLRNGDLEYLSTIEQLVDALLKTEDPASRFALRGHVTPPGQKRLRHSMRAALWWLLPLDGEFRRASHSLHYYLARQGWRVNWVIDPAPPASRHPATEASPAPTLAILMPSSGASSQPPRRQKSRRRRRRKAARAANRNSASRQADLTTPAALSANKNAAHWRTTQPRSAANDHPEMRSTSVEHPHSFTSSPLTQLLIPTANQNSGSASRQDHSEIWGFISRPKPTPDRI